MMTTATSGKVSNTSNCESNGSNSSTSSSSSNNGNNHSNDGNDRNHNNNTSVSRDERTCTYSNNASNCSNSSNNKKPIESQTLVSPSSTVVKALSRPTIAIDVDEVLAQLVHGVAQFHNDKFGTNLTLKDFHSYNFADVWGGTTEEAMDKVTDFFGTHYFHDLAVVPGAQEAIKQLREKFDLVVVTSRQFYIEEETRRWIERHFPNTFSKILFGNHWTKEGQYQHGVFRSKKELCEMCGAICLVDDAPKYMSETHEHLVLSILFDLDNSYGWSRDYQLPADNCFRCACWDEVLKHVIPLESWSTRDCDSGCNQDTAKAAGNEGRKDLLPAT
eukprot:GHVQ01016860.1.p1 GENE.GHVQ01016860.1~~GHVQ01016860.1.p1  ORF type:complete len:331 (+),score=57.62 GHVQ01016860.1:305-1297(+)